MPTLIWSKVKDGLDPSMKKKAYTFFEKLREDDTLPGLHIEPIKGSVDKRVRTGRVDDNFRCILFKITADDDPVYVIHGVWPHDKANSLAERVRLSMNPINGVPEVERVVSLFKEAAAEGQVATVDAPAPATEQVVAPVPETLPTDPSPVPEPVELPVTAEEVFLDAKPTWPAGVTAQGLHDELGIDQGLATDALTAETETGLAAVIERASVAWQGEALLELATGNTVAEVRSMFRLDADVDLSAGSEDERLLQSLKHPAATSSFHWVEDDDELRQIIEAGDLGAWRLFLHPEQRRYVDDDYPGTTRLAGGAGTGKTVVAVHRARRLAVDDPDARVLLTTFTRNLADDLAASLRRLDDTVQVRSRLDEPGIYVKGVDAVAWAVVQRAGADIESAVAAVLGMGSTSVLGSTAFTTWKEAIADAGDDLPKELRTESFFEAEYSMVVLPNRITTSKEYARVRRSGRGVALGRSQRMAVWAVIEDYRLKARAAGTTDFDEKAAIAAEWLAETGEPPFDHVLVDEAQDLTPSRLRLLRNLVAEGPNDLFICEDSHQRIYGQKVTLSHVGINVRGRRSKRLTLNYRTTAQNLGWAMAMLAGGEYTDLEGRAEAHGYHSARTGPVPLLLRADSMAEELDVAAELIKSWLPHDGAGDDVASAPEAIAVLVRDRYRRENVVNGLSERGVEMRSVDQESAKPGKPLVMTMHRAKGLEFTHVLLFGIHEGSVPRAMKEYEISEQDHADAMLRERSLIYVAATRARDVLTVTWSGERSPLLPA